MRARVRAGEVTLALVVGAFAAAGSGCARGCGGSDQAGTAQPVPSASAPPVHASPAVANGPCNPGPDSLACSPDGVAVLTCAGGAWRALETCRGPNHCQGAGATLSCDSGDPEPGDACVAARARPRCRDPRHLLACQDGRWTASECPAGKACGALAEGRDFAGQVGCK